MNVINKTYPEPGVLTTHKLSLTASAIKQVEAGDNKVTFDHDIYGHSDVKRQLIENQHGKCAYCEHALNGDFGDVEHFRPKAGYCTNQGEKLNKPGYYWLAYEWGNLLLSCSKCNRIYKGNLFPLLDETTRDIKNRDIARETPLLINPSQEDPGNHICFEQHIIKPRTHEGKEDIVGAVTINTFKLNDREDLVESRRRRWEEYRTKLETIRIFEAIVNDERCRDLDIPDQLQKEKDLLETIKSEHSEFTGMFKYQI